MDYAALGGRKFIGNPKVATIFICELIDGEYQMTSFRGTDRIVSPTFPQLNLTVQQVFDSVVWVIIVGWVERSVTQHPILLTIEITKKVEGRREESIP